MSKHYCEQCAFFKEDTILRFHPQLLKQGLEINTYLCNICYEGLKNRKSQMKFWMNEKVIVPYSLSGPQQKIDDTVGLLITKVSYCVLSKVVFSVNQELQIGYATGLLTSYAFEDSSHSVRDWKEIVFKMHNVTKRYGFYDPFFSSIEKAGKFMLLNGKSYIQ